MGRFNDVRPSRFVYGRRSIDFLHPVTLIDFLGIILVTATRPPDTLSALGDLDRHIVLRCRCRLCDRSPVHDPKAHFSTFPGKSGLL